MKLHKLTLKNFKGIQFFELDARGENISVYGENATGKTTIYDAFLWLLFDKDSQNRKDFEIKTLNTDGQHIHGLNHEVEATLQLSDGQNLTLKKSFEEKWTKKRGSASREFTGHTTHYFINDVPVKKKEYTAKIEEIADESIFKLLTSPTYFNTQLHWQDRRNILLQVCGDVTDEEVINSDEALKELPDILQGRSLDDHRKVVQSRRTEINKELERIPVRIDEVQQGLPDITGLDPESLSSQVSEFKELRQEKEQELTRLQSGGEVAEKNKKLREIESELLQIKNSHGAEVSEQIDQKRTELNNLQNQKSKLQGDIKTKQREKQTNDRHIETMEKQMQELRDKWHEVNSEEFTFEQDDTCPTCGQSLPAEQIEEARQKAQEHFNKEKAEKLEKISAQGKSAKQDKEKAESENYRLDKEIESLQNQVADIELKEQELQAEIDRLSAQTSDPTESKEYQQKLQEKQDLEKQIAELKQGNEQAIAQVKEKISGIDAKIEGLQGQMAQVEQHQKGQERIEELKEQERKLAKEYEQLEQQLYLTERFIRQKVNLLEEKINSKFKHARFKLFEQQINGGLVETCETLYEGVPYSSGLNNAARINVGLDIINTLSEHYNFVAPIFIDNREAVTQLIETRGQVISLFVSEGDKKLRVEAESKNINKEAV